MDVYHEKQKLLKEQNAFEKHKKDVELAHARQRYDIEEQHKKIENEEAIYWKK